MNDLIENVFQFMESRKTNIERGEINGIPFAVNEFRCELPVLEKGSYIICTGQTKAGKSKLANFLIVYNAVFYSFFNKDKCRVKILYFPLEETPQEITLRFMAYVLNRLSDGKYRVDPNTLKSVDQENLLPDEVLSILKSEKYRAILDYYEKCVDFCTDTSSVGIDIRIRKYAKEHGTIVYEDTVYTNELGEEIPTKEIVDYVPDDPKEYVIPFVDHVSLLTPTRQEGTLFNAIGSLSRNFVKLKNKFHYMCVAVQQQSTETGGLDARKTGNIRATKAALADNKSTGNDCTLLIGITSPYAFEYQNYLGYDLSKLKDNFRVMEVILNRNGKSNGLCPLLLDGATDTFSCLPAPNDNSKMQNVYNIVDHVLGRRKRNASFLLYKVKQRIYAITNRKK